MKYKVGDKVKIKTREERLQQNIVGCFSPMEDEIERKFSDRILTIESVVDDSFYIMEQVKWFWSDSMIKCIVKDYKDIKPIRHRAIQNRFEILDL